MIRAVLLDAGNTLLFVDPHRMREIFSAEGVETDLETFREAEYEARTTLARAVEEGEGGTEDHVWEKYFVTLFRRAGVPEERIPAVGRRVQGVHREDHLWTHVPDGIPEALSCLEEAGLRLGVVSNADGRVEALLERAGLRSSFEFVLDSHVVGVEKPDPQIFQLAVERLELAPRECLYVGDLYPVDVVGARRAGLPALLVDPYGRSEAPVDRIPSVAHLPEYLNRRSGGG